MAKTEKTQLGVENETGMTFDINHKNWGLIPHGDDS